MPSAFHDLPASAFPFTVQMWGPGADRDGPPTLEQVGDGPGAMHIPGLGAGTYVRVTFADGRVEEAEAPGAGSGSAATG